MSNGQSIKTCKSCHRTYCDNYNKRKQFCSHACYIKWANAPIEERFQRFVGSPEDNGCVLWTGTTNTRGYGVIAHNNGTKSINGHRIRVLAHRLSWIISNGPVADDVYVLHKCDNPTCVNIDHLFIGTRADNNRDMMQKGRMARGEACHRSHLTNESVLSIRADYASGMTQRSIARKYGIVQQTVHRIVSRKTWSHV